MQLGNLISQRGIYNIEKEYDERNRINMIDDNKSDGINQIGKNGEDISTDDIEVFKLGALVSKRYIYTTEV